jgi:hypothetical protein
MKKSFVSLLIYSLVVPPVYSAETFMADTEDIKKFDKVLLNNFKKLDRKKNSKKTGDQQGSLLEQMLNDESVKEVVYTELSDEIEKLRESVREYLLEIQNQQSKSSKRFIEEVSLLDSSDPNALEFAREIYANKFSEENDLPTDDPEPTPEPDPEPTPEPDPEPTPEPDPEPTPEPDPEPTPEPDPEPTPDPDPEPTPEPDPVPTPDPDPVPTPDPDPVPTPDPDPTPKDKYQKRIDRLNGQINKIKLRIIASHVKKLHHIERIREKRSALLEKKLSRIDSVFGKIIERVKEKSDKDELKATRKLKREAKKYARSNIKAKYKERIKLRREHYKALKQRLRAVQKDRKIRLKRVLAIKKIRDKIHVERSKPNVNEKRIERLKKRIESKREKFNKRLEKQREKIIEKSKRVQEVREKQKAIIKARKEAKEKKKK